MIKALIMLTQHKGSIAMDFTMIFAEFTSTDVNDAIAQLGDDWREQIMNEAYYSFINGHDAMFGCIAYGEDFSTHECAECMCEFIEDIIG